MPTAGAVVSDVAAILSGLATKEKECKWRAAPEGYVKPFEDNSFSYYVRVKADSRADALEAAALSFGGASELCGSPEGYVEYITDPCVEKSARAIIESGALGEVESFIRIMK